MDNRNYMVWGYRLDMLDLQKIRFKTQKAEKEWKDLLEQEMLWINLQIDKDIRNNSAWNYRFNIIKEKKVSFDEDLKFVCDKIKERVTNEAAWNYFNGLVRIHHEKNSQGCFLKKLTKRNYNDTEGFL